MSEHKPGDSLFAAGMRDHEPDICWRLLSAGHDCCIRERGHDDGIHESSELPEAMRLADLLAAEFALRKVLDEDEASSAVVCLRELDFVIVAPQYLAEAALVQEGLRDA